MAPAGTHCDSVRLIHVDYDGDGQPDADKTLNPLGQVVEVGNPKNIIDATPGRWGDPKPDPSDWKQNRPQKIDDLWHAAANSDGMFTSAATPQELTDRLLQALARIQSRQTSATTVAATSSSIGPDTRLYLAKLDSADWSGDLVSIPVSNGTGNLTCTLFDDKANKNPSDDTGDPIGKLCAGEWSAGAKLAARGPDTRNIVAYVRPGAGDPAGNPRGIAFDSFDNLTVAQKAALNASDGRGLDRFAFLRGEGITGFRSRGGRKLGDITSSPVLVAAPVRFYRDSLEAKPYTAFLN